VELVREFNIPGQGQALLAYAVAHPDESAATDALRQVISSGDSALIETQLKGDASGKLISLLARSQAQEFFALFEQVVNDSSRDLAVRRSAAQGLAQTHDGAGFLLRWAESRGPDDALKPSVLAELRRTRWEDIRAKASSLAEDRPERGDTPAW